MDIRETIIEAALKLLRRQGFASLSQPRIAAEAGVRQGHLTYYFPARADLLLAVADRSCDILLAPLHERARRGELTAEEIADRLGAAATDRGMARIFHTLVSMSEEDESLKRQMRTLQDDSVRDLRDLFGGAGLALTRDDALLLHALMYGASTMFLSVCTPASRREARGVLRHAVALIEGRATPIRAARRSQEPAPKPKPKPKPKPGKR